MAQLIENYMEDPTFKKIMESGKYRMVILNDHEKN